MGYNLFCPLEQNVTTSKTGWVCGLFLKFEELNKENIFMLFEVDVEEKKLQSTIIILFELPAFSTVIN